MIGASKIFIPDLRREFVEDLCLRAIQCNAQYEGRYLLGTSLARPVIARAQMQVAAQEGCEYVSHGCTGKGNDQVRFELAFLTINPKIKIIAPWRMPEFFERFQGRNDLLSFAAETNIPVTSTKAKPYSMDDNLAHCSYESGQLEDPSQPPPNDMWTRCTASNLLLIGTLFSQFGHFRSCFFSNQPFLIGENRARATIKSVSSWRFLPSTPRSR
jgi:argininosuccinate synthase